MTARKKGRIQEAKKLRFKRRQRPGHAETDVRVPVPGTDPVPGARANALGVAVPGTAANDAGRVAIFGCPNRLIFECISIIFVPMVGAPFPDIAKHVVEIPRVSFERSDLGRTIEIVVGPRCVEPLAPVTGGVRGRAAGIFHPKL